ncbi:MAG: imidazolonepropionase [Desulfurococcales archaeon]|nr:imidazolonepropionase [Desulfurococcales archaeon]
MPRVDLLIHNIGELVTFREGPLPGSRARDPKAAGIIHNAAVAIRGGRIVDVGPSGGLRARYNGTVEIDAGGRLATPGLVDNHTHLVFAGSREDEFELKLLGYSYAEILARGGGIYRTVRATREASVGELRALALKRLRLMVEHGTTVVEVKTGYGLLPEYELKMLRALEGLDAPGLPRIVPTLLAHVIPEEYRERRGEYVDLFIRELIPRAREEKVKPVYVDVFCDRGVFTVEETRRIIEAGLRHGYRVRLHADELAYIGCSALAGEYPIDSLDHLEYLPPENARLLAERGTVATLLPTSMLTVFSDKKPPVEELRRAGAVIAVSTDYNPNNMNPILSTTMDLSTYLYRMTPLEALAATTINPARSLGLDDVHGRIAPGAYADIVVWDMPNYRWIGYEWGYDRVLTVVARGTIVRDLIGGVENP